MTLEARAFELAYLDSPEAMLAHLAGAFADGNPGRITDALGAARS